MIREFLVWLATQVGKGPGEFDPSWSDSLASSLNFWGLLEGTHVLSLMLFAGTIFIVDLRLLGGIFKRTPISVLSNKILPLTIFGLLIMLATGVALFYAKPLLYYHNMWFRLKLVFLVVAAINISGQSGRTPVAQMTTEFLPRLLATAQRINALMRAQD